MNHFDLVHHNLKPNNSESFASPPVKIKEKKRTAQKKTNKKEEIYLKNGQKETQRLLVLFSESKPIKLT